MVLDLTLRRADGRIQHKRINDPDPLAFGSLCPDLRSDGFYLTVNRVCYRVISGPEEVPGTDRYRAILEEHILAPAPRPVGTPLRKGL